MYEKTQPLMRSQFILTYGPGAIIESENGPRLIPSLDIGMKDFSKVTKNYRISDIRMEQLINNVKGANENIRLFTLPSNASEGENDSKGLYKTMIFPAWKICYNSKDHDSNSDILYNSRKSNGKCPECGKESSSHVRFVLACSSGHLDDVDWNYAVHKGKECANKNHFKWITGRSISDIKIICPKCGESTTVKDIYDPRITKFWCKARLPEKERFKNYNDMVGYGNYLKPEIKAKDEGIDNYDPNVHRHLCNKPMRVIQRQSTSLRVPITKTLLTLPEYDTDQVDLIQEQGDIGQSILLEMHNFIKDGMSFDEAFDKSGGRHLDKNVIDELNKDPEDFLEKAAEIYTHDGTYFNLLNDEFNSLSDPSQKNSKNFIKGKPQKVDIDIFDIDFSLNVFPIKKIRTITTQIGYQRIVGKPDEDGKYKTRYIGKKSNMPGNNYYWYPAFEGIGEGIFITSDLNPLETFELDKNISEWENVNNPIISNNIPQETYKPLYVWWHTLSHAIIRQLGYESGYSSSSIRERIYATEEGKGGILLYNTSPGDDSGMGGLVSSVDNFKEIVEKALKNIANCSNDPLCEIVRVKPTSVNGSACINCLFLSETSCECGNQLLDRHMLLGD